MADSNGAGDDLPTAPLRLFERLAQIRGYSWDQTIQPFHSVSFLPYESCERSLIHGVVEL